MVKIIIQNIFRTISQVNKSQNESYDFSQSLNLNIKQLKSSQKSVKKPQKNNKLRLSCRAHGLFNHHQR